jgi:hypothetical protein
VSGEVLAIVLTISVHFIGAGLLVGLLFSGEDADWRSWWPRDDDGRGGEPRRPEGPPELPLPGAERSRARLREHGERIAGAYARPARRPAPAREREPVGR